MHGSHESTAPPAPRAGLYKAGGIYYNPGIRHAGPGPYYSDPA